MNLFNNDSFGSWIRSWFVIGILSQITYINLASYRQLLYVVCTFRRFKWLYIFGLSILTLLPISFKKLLRHSLLIQTGKLSNLLFVIVQLRLVLCFSQSICGFTFWFLKVNSQSSYRPWFANYFVLLSLPWFTMISWSEVTLKACFTIHFGSVLWLA